MNDYIGMERYMNAARCQEMFPHTLYDLRPLPEPDEERLFFRRLPGEEFQLGTHYTNAPANGHLPGRWHFAIMRIEARCPACLKKALQFKIRVLSRLYLEQPFDSACGDVAPAIFIPPMAAFEVSLSWRNDEEGRKDYSLLKDDLIGIYLKGAMGVLGVL